jgi:hypothetical protein
VSASGRGDEERSWCAGKGEPGKLLGHAEGKEERRRKESRGLGCAWGRGEVGRTSWTVREGEEKGRPGLGASEKRKGKKKKKSDRIQLENEREK